MLLDLVRSTQAFLLSRQRNAGELSELVAALAERLWGTDAETIAFTGDGLLSFVEETGRPSRMAWALYDSLRDCELVVAENAGRLNLPLRLRGGVHYGDVLQVVDGPFEGQMIGRTIGMMEEVVETARQGDRQARSILSVAVTGAARERLQIPVFDVPIHPSPHAQLLAGGLELHLFDSPPLQARAACRKTTAGPPEFTGVVGHVLYLDLKRGPGGNPFPGLVAYLQTMWELCELASNSGFGILNVMPTGVLAFAEDMGYCGAQLDQAIERLFGAEPLDGPGLLCRASRSGWLGLQLRGGLVRGQVVRPLTGPLTGQSLGPPLALAARLKVQAAGQTGAAISLCMPKGLWCGDGSARFTKEDIPATAKDLARADIRNVEVLSSRP